MSSSVSPVGKGQTDEITDFILAIGKDLGVPPEDLQPSIKVLHDNWYKTVESLRKIPSEGWNRLAIPGRLVDEIRERLRTTSGSGDVDGVSFVPVVPVGHAMTLPDDENVARTRFLEAAQALTAAKGEHAVETFECFGEKGKGKHGGKRKGGKWKGEIVWETRGGSAGGKQKGGEIHWFEKEYGGSSWFPW